MNFRKDHLERALGEYLDRRFPPRGMSEAAQVREIDALVRAVLSTAPREGYQEWWPRLEDQLDSIMQTRSWPTVNQIRAAAKLVVKNTGEREELPPMDPIKIRARQIKAGEIVGDEWIYGVCAVSLVKSGDIREEDLTPYRSALYFRMADVWGKDAASKWEMRFRKKHDEARMDAGLDPIFSVKMIEKELAE